MFLVTGSTEKNRLKPASVFQEYNFPYRSPNLPTIIANINPDIAIYLGEIRDIPDCLSGITNIILSLKDSNVKELIYISSLSIFNGNQESFIDEGTEPSPRGNLEKALFMGEEIFEKYSREENFSLSILRFSQIYGRYNQSYLKDNICTEICEKVIEDKEVEISKTKRHNLIYIDDAVDSIYKVIHKEKKTNEIYHIGAKREEEYSEREIIDILKEEIEVVKKIKYIEKDDDILEQEFSVEKIERLGFVKKYDLKDRVAELYTAVKKSKDDYSILEDENPSLLSKIFKIEGRTKKRLLPFVENLAFFLLLSVFIYFTREMSFHEIIDLHLLYVIIIGLIYGYEQSIWTIILSVIGKIYISLNWNIPGLELKGYFIYIWILELFVIGLLVGYLKEQYKMKYKDMKDENEYLEVQLADIKSINQKNEEVKELYENRLLNYRDSFGRIYEIVSKLDLIEPEAIVFRSIGVIEDIMNSNDVSIYLGSENAYFYRLVASSAKRSKNFQPSLKVSEYREVFDKLEKKEIYTNPSLDPNYPIMAGGLYKEDNLQSIIMIWSLPFESNNLYQMNIFGIVCKLIEGSLNLAYEYMENINQSNNLEYSNILNKEGFSKVLKLYESGSEEGIVEYYLLKAKMDARMTREEFLEILNKNLRNTDYIGVEEDGYFNVILTNTNKEGSSHVVSRLEENGIIVKKGESLD